MRTLTSVLCALGISVFAGTATAEGTSQIGFYFGSSDFDKSIAAGEPFDMEGENVGLIYRTSTPVKGSGGFLGFEMAVAKEFVSGKETESGNVSGDTLSISAESSVEWSMDMMPRIGYKFGDLSVSLAAGLSFIQEQFKLLGSVNGITYPSLTVKDTQLHTGFKIAPGIDYELSENITLFGQVQYAKYNSKTYSGPEISYNIRPEMYGIRAGMLFGF